MIEYTLRELECFHAVAEELNFTRAAERLHLSQPPLSRHVRELEKRLGAKLFERDRRRVSLTADGRVFRAETRGVLEQLARAQQRVREHAAGAGRTLDIAFVGALLSDALVDTLRGVQTRCPDAHLTLHDRTPSEQLEGLARGRLDLGFIGPAPEVIPKGVAVFPWRTEALHVMVPRGHRWRRRTRISLRALEGQPLATVSPEAAPAYNQWLQRRFVQSGIRPLFVQRADRARAVCTMAAVSGYLAVLIESACRPLEGCTSIPVTDELGNPVELTLDLACRPAFSELAEGLMETG